MNSKKIVHVINPVNRLGKREYSFLTPIIVTVLIFVIIEAYAYLIAKNPLAVGLPAIVLAICAVAYFAFRDGIRGGVEASLISVFYYFYVIYSRKYSGKLLDSGIETTIFLGVIYLFTGYLIGWLRQRIDVLIEHEANEKIRLQTILQQMPVGVLITDKKGKIEYINKKLDLIVGNKFSVEKRRGSQYGVVYATVTNVLNSKKNLIDKEFTIERLDNKKFYIRINAAPIYDKNGNLMAAVSTVDDITEQKELEQRKDDFISVASHELKTPITSLNLYTDSLRAKANGLKDKKAKYIIDNIKTQIDRLQRLVNELLDVSRIQTGKIAFNKEKFRLDELVAETAEVLQGTTNQKIIILKKTPISIYADKFRIYQVVTNIISNAIKYSSAVGDITIMVTRNSGKALVSIADLGIGISKDEQEKIFDKLYQVGDNVGKTYPGFGIGLFIAKEIMKRHKGKIWVESEKGKGSTFYFSLPLN